jgi:16S rRNA (guanine527-N7)-methyltransferase
MAADPSPEQLARLRAFAAAVQDSPHNLVSRRAREELWERHVMEAVAFAHMLPTATSLLDVGSGGGFPGLVVAIMRPELRVTLLDASAKKTAFLRTMVVELGLTADVVRGRAEELRDGPLAAAFELVTARAVAPLDRLLGWTIPFVTPGGELHAIKGARWDVELHGARTELRRWGATVARTPADAPPQDGQPIVVVIRKDEA